jgi:hypothetical protein
MGLSETITDIDIRLGKEKRDLLEEYNSKFSWFNENTLADVVDIASADLEIERQKILSRLIDIRDYFKDRVNNPHDRELVRLGVIRQLYILGVPWVTYGQGLVLFNDTKIDKPIIYALQSGKWRVKGKQIWYRSGGVQKFIEKYIRDKE